MLSRLIRLSPAFAALPVRVHRTGAPGCAGARRCGWDGIGCPSPPKLSCAFLLSTARMHSICLQILSGSGWLAGAQAAGSRACTASWIQTRSCKCSRRLVATQFRKYRKQYNLSRRLLFCYSHFAWTWPGFTEMNCMLRGFAILGLLCFNAVVSSARTLHAADTNVAVIQAADTDVDVGSDVGSWWGRRVEVLLAVMSRCPDGRCVCVWVQAASRTTPGHGLRAHLSQLQGLHVAGCLCTVLLGPFRCLAT